MQQCKSLKYLAGSINDALEKMKPERAAIGTLIFLLKFTTVSDKFIKTRNMPSGWTRNTFLYLTTE